MDRLGLDDLNSNPDQFKPMSYEDRMAYQVLQNKFIEVLPFIPIGERYISLVYNLEVFVTVVYALRLYLVGRAFKMKVFTLSTFLRGKSE